MRIRLDKLVMRRNATVHEETVAELIANQDHLNKPIAVRGRVVVNGVQRVAARRRLGFEDVEVIEVNQ